MLICENCKQEIKGDALISASSGKPMHTECASKCRKCGSPITDMESLNNSFMCTGCNKKEESKLIKLEHVRRSYIELYKNCPYAFYNIAVKGVELPNGVYALHGIILHDLFDKYSTSEEKESIDLVKEFTKRFNEEVLEEHLDFKLKPDLRQQLYDKGLVAIENYLTYESSARKPFETEVNITYTVGENLPKVSITFDRLEEDENGDLHLIDYKCGKVYSGQKLVTDLQLPLYALAIKSQYGKFPKTFNFIFMSENKNRLYELREDGNYVCQVGKRTYISNVTEAIREVKQILGDIEKNKFSVPQKLQGWYCDRMCSLKKYEICGGRDLQLWKGFK